MPKNKDEIDLAQTLYTITCCYPMPRCLTRLPLPYAVFERLFFTDASFRSGEILELTAGLDQVQQ